MAGDKPNVGLLLLGAAAAWYFFLRTPATTPADGVIGDDTSGDIILPGGGGSPTGGGPVDDGGYHPPLTTSPTDTSVVHVPLDDGTVVTLPATPVDDSGYHPPPTVTTPIATPVDDSGYHPPIVTTPIARTPIVTTPTVVAPPPSDYPPVVIPDPPFLPPGVPVQPQAIYVGDTSTPLHPVDIGGGVTIPSAIAVIPMIPNTSPYPVEAQSSPALDKGTLSPIIAEPDVFHGPQHRFSGGDTSTSPAPASDFAPVVIPPSTPYDIVTTLSVGAQPATNVVPLDAIHNDRLGPVTTTFNVDAINDAFNAAAGGKTSTGRTNAL